MRRLPELSSVSFQWVELQGCVRAARCFLTSMDAFEGCSHAACGEHHAKIGRWSRHQRRCDRREDRFPTPKMPTLSSIRSVVEWETGNRRRGCIAVPHLPRLLSCRDPGGDPAAKLLGLSNFNSIARLIASLVSFGALLGSRSGGISV